MAREKTPAAAPSAEDEKKRIENEKKDLKKKQKDQKKEAKRRAKEIAKQEEELGLDEGNGLVTFGATVLIVFLWIAVVCVIVKLDIGGFGSTVLAPILKDVPVVNKILPGVSLTETDNPENYGGYSSLQEAVDYIRQLELELEQVRTASGTKDEDIERLLKENERLKEFENMQVDFQRIQTKFGEEVIYAEETLYKQVILQQEESKEIQEFAESYSSMKPKEAAGIFNEMTDNLNLVAKILNAMSADERGKILGAMDAEVAARLTKIMDPDT